MAVGTAGLPNSLAASCGQVIGEAILSLGPEECDRVFPELYLPVMTESNRRVLRPWRKYIPTSTWFDYNSRVKRRATFPRHWMEEKRERAPLPKAICFLAQEQPA